MQSIKVPLKEAEKVKLSIIENDLFDKDYKIKKDKKNIYFPINSVYKIRKNFPEYEIVKTKLEKRMSEQNAKEKLVEKLSKEELEIVKTSFDVVGDIAILEIPVQLEKKEKVIAEAIMSSNKTIKTILKKSGIHHGEFRTQNLAYVLGENKKETTYKENNVKIKVDVEKVYFSPRLSTERKRIASQVKEGENILVMFSGAAPYPVVLSKNTKAKRIVGVELNPIGHKYALENVKINKADNIELYCGDAKDVVPKLKEKFDRILMPLPKSAEDFLDTALQASKKDTVIHFYDFLHESNFQDAIKKLEDACKKRNFDFKVISINKCGQHSPYIFRICVDFQIK